MYSKKKLHSILILKGDINYIYIIKPIVIIELKKELNYTYHQYQYLHYQ